MKSKVTRDAVNRRLSYDPLTGDFTRRIRSGAFAAGTIAGSMTTWGYREISLSGNRFLAHRLAWFVTYGKWPEGQIDHRNGDRSDNRIANLREATSAQNQANQAIRKTNKSGFKGVSFDKLTGKWRADISIGGTGKYLGSFSRAEHAAEAARRAREVIHGEFANHGD